MACWAKSSGKLDRATSCRAAWAPPPANFTLQRSHSVAAVALRDCLDFKPGPSRNRRPNGCRSNLHLVLCDDGRPHRRPCEWFFRWLLCPLRSRSFTIDHAVEKLQKFLAKDEKCLIQIRTSW